MFIGQRQTFANSENPDLRRLSGRLTVQIFNVTRQLSHIEAAPVLVGATVFCYIKRPGGREVSAADFDHESPRSNPSEGGFQFITVEHFIA